MVERCVRCNVDGEKVRLFDAIYEGRIESLCERCSIIENIPIIKKPATSQLKESEKGVGVYSRMKRLSGIQDSRKEETFFREDRLRELNENPSLEVPEKDSLNLIDHFHWEIMKNRRRKGLSQKQLAENLGESEIAIQMLEKEKLPEKAEQIIKKIEQYFQVRLTKISDSQIFLQTKTLIPVLLDNQGKELNKIPEPEIKKEIKEKSYEEKSEDEMLVDDFLEDVEIGVNKPKEEKFSEIKEFKKDEVDKLDDDKKENDLEKPKPELTGINIEKGEFDIEKANLSAVKISDLKELHRKKIEVTRKEQIEEQKKIEARNRLIEARKEELRLIKEKESNELDKILGGTELLETGSEINELNNSKDVEEFE